MATNLEESACKVAARSFDKSPHHNHAYNQQTLEQYLEQGFKNPINVNTGNDDTTPSYFLDPCNLSVTGLCSTYSDFAAPIRRQFWKAGEYGTEHAPQPRFQGRQNCLRVRPKFLHSNATSHKWVFGCMPAVAFKFLHLCVRNGASYVMLDKVINLRHGSPALLIQDDGGGMDPESLRSCMSFGFSDKRTHSIGHYGNGFKTSTMRLGADVIVFSCCKKGGKLTRSIGLLSYTFLRQAGSDDVVIPVVDYELDVLTGNFRRLLRRGEVNFLSSMDMLLKWSPFATENELLNQFNDIRGHGTKVIVFNLWYNDDGKLELDFETDPKDVMINGSKTISTNNTEKKERHRVHIANLFQHSFRVYASILYLHMPENFRIILRGEVVNHHQIANDIKYRQCIKYSPQVQGHDEAVVITTIGFVKDAPLVNVHGFCIYHKNRLILPFLRVLNVTNNNGRGVTGVLEANFIKPTHNKQDFEKSVLYKRLEACLRDMTIEYWNYHCHLIGCAKGRPRWLPPPPTSASATQLPHLENLNASNSPCQLPCSLGLLEVNRISSNIYESNDFVTLQSAPSCSTRAVSYRDALQIGPQEMIRKVNPFYEEVQEQIVAADSEASPKLDNGETQVHSVGCRPIGDIIVLQNNKRLRAECIKYERIESELLLKMQQLTDELQEVQHVYGGLLNELKAIEDMKPRTCRKADGVIFV